MAKNEMSSKASIVEAAVNLLNKSCITINDSKYTFYETGEKGWGSCAHCETAEICDNEMLALCTLCSFMSGAAGRLKMVE